MKFESPSKTLSVKRTGDFFVHDRANGTTENCVHTSQMDIALLQQFQRDEQIYAYTLFSLGHKLALDKCKFYIANYKWDNNTFRYKHMSVAETPGQVFIRDSFEGEPFAIHRLEPHDPHTSL